MYRPNCRNCPPVNFQLTSPPPASCHLVSSGHTLHCPPLFGWKVPNTHPFKVINHLSMMLGNSHMLSTDHRTLRRWSPNGCQMVTRSSPNGHLAVTNFQKLLDSASSIKKCLVEILKLMLDRFSEDEIWSRFLLNFWYDLRSYFGKLNSTLGSVVPLAMLQIVITEHCWSYF